jgi:diguanylate cyclase (GGDEF)-like protein/PAS domain S-box-containing protein
MSPSLSSLQRKAPGSWGWAACVLATLALAGAGWSPFGVAAAALLVLTCAAVALRPRRRAGKLPVPVANAALDAAARLRHEHERAVVALQSVADAVITVDAQGCIDSMNPVAQHLTGWSETGARGRAVRDVFRIEAEAQDNAQVDPLGECVARGAPMAFVGDYLLHEKNGGYRAVDVSVAPLVEPDGMTRGAVIVFRDVSAPRHWSQQLAWQADHDALTGLVNRGRFERCVELAMESAKSRGERHALVHLDLDHFRIVNDTCGHAAGDRLLRELAHVLASHVGGNDVLARLGGDEFGVLMRDCALDEAVVRSERMRAILERHRFRADGKSWAVAGSFGVAALDAACATLGEVLRASDAACRLAKEGGRNRVHRAHGSDNEVRRRQTEAEWIGRVRRALEEDRFVLYGQAIVPLGPAGAAHTEVLVRMRDEEGALVLPMAWIPAAERYGLMPEVDRWVIHNTFRHMAARARVMADHSLCAINLSATSLTDAGMLDFVRRQLDAHGVHPAQVCFEITETAVIANLERAQLFVAELRRLGVRFALDDFGSGMSSFAYLKALPVDFLKIDGSFVRRIAFDPVDHAMVEAINKLGHVMKISTVAEFSENEAVLALLRQMGVDFAQGNGIAEPRPLTEVLPLPPQGVTPMRTALPLRHGARQA